MSLLEKMLTQKAVYWGKATVAFDEYGKPLHTTPVQILCRWVETAEQFIAADGTTQVSTLKVYVGQDVEVGGLLMRGELTEVQESTFPDNPKEAVGVEEIKSFKKVPDFRGTRFLREALL